MSESTLCLDVEVWYAPYVGIRKSQIFPRRNTKTKNEKTLMGMVSINLGVVHAEEGSLVEVFIEIYSNYSSFQ